MVALFGTRWWVLHQAESEQMFIKGGLWLCVQIEKKILPESYQHLSGDMGYVLSMSGKLRTQ